MAQTPTRKQLSANELLQSLATAINNSDHGDYVDFEFIHGCPQGTLRWSWSLDDETEVQLETLVSYDIITDCDGSSIDIDKIKINRISIGDGYDNDVIEVAGINEHNVAPLFTAYFDKHNETSGWDDEDYCVNLKSEYAKRRGGNWVLIEEMAA